MGSGIEVNDTLNLSDQQGFPCDVFDLERHKVSPITLADVRDRIFSFADKPDARIFHLDPVRVFLVQNLGGKWLFWGKILMQSQTIYKSVLSGSEWRVGEWMTSGTYKVIDVFEPDYQKLFTMRESPPGKSFF
jgi:hypothetical protein